MIATIVIIIGDIGQGSFVRFDLQGSLMEQMMDQDFIPPPLD